jgi:O-antigen/teichoic acid export membrane protein
MNCDREMLHTASDKGAQQILGEITPNAKPHLTSGRLLARNTIWNLIGNGAPMIVAVFSMPILIRGLGKDRFGVLALAWGLIGYASLFDMGLGRALTQLVAKKLGEGDDKQISTLVSTSLLLMLAMGVVGTAVIGGLAPWLIHRMLKIPEGLQPEALRSFYLLALSVPIVISTAGLRGLLEAYQRFGIINALRAPMGIFAFAGPLLVLPFSKSLSAVVAVLVIGRFLAWCAHLFFCLRVIPSLLSGVLWQRSAVGPLMRFGSWMTVSNIVGPLMVTFDRFVIGSLLSVGAVAYYTTPYEVISKLWLIPASLLSVMFPAFSTSFVQDRNRAAMLYARSVKYLLLALFPLILLIVALAQDGLTIWLGADFAQQSTRVLQWLAVGAFINCLGSSPFAVVQGAGRPDLTAKLHLIELPLYILALFWLTKTKGIEGAAIAWTVRVAIDAAALFVIAKRFLPVRSSAELRTIIMFASAMAIFVFATFLRNWETRGLFVLSTFLGFVLVAWFLVLSPEERKLAQQIS